MSFISVFYRIVAAASAIFIGVCSPLLSTPPTSPNQTDTLSPIFPQDTLPFTISIEQAPFTLPNGIHSGAFASYHGKWLFIAGRTNGLHGFAPTDDNFPPSKQNTIVYVVDLERQKIYSRELDDPSSGLSQAQIDQLSVTSPQFFQNGKTLYISGGYGIDTATGLFNTKPVLTAINIPGLMKWVKYGGGSAVKHIRQTFHPLLQVTGGYMTAVNPHLSTLLIFGQNFSGFYHADSNGDYTQQVRSFQIIDTHKKLYIQPRKTRHQNPNYRRRDLNVVPVILDKKMAYVALSGVFTLDTGVWTVPVIIKSNGSSHMADPSKPKTFKQGMNNYNCPSIGLYSHSKKNMYITLCGGISYGFFQEGSFQVDSEIPFINEVTTIKINKHGKFTQYLMNNEYPEILSTSVHAGNPLLFGAGAFYSSRPSSYL